MKPFIIALDIELGVNLFKYVWADINREVGDTFFRKIYAGCGSDRNVCVDGESETGCTNPLVDNCESEIPYAMSDMAALDLFKGVANDGDNITPGSDTVCNQVRAQFDGVGEDDFTDTIYVGDLNGTFYRIAINFDQTINEVAGDKNIGVRVDLWHTKPIYSDDEPSNIFRGERQPIASRPAISYDLVEDAVRIVFGTGKYEAVSWDWSDKTDSATMSLYGLKDVLDPANRTIDSAATYGGALSLDENFEFQVYPHCWDPAPDYRCVHPNNSGDDSDCQRSGTETDGGTTGTTVNYYGCNWVRADQQVPDCCEDDCSNSCWSCVFDLIGQGERIVNKPVIAGQLVFVTTLEPTLNPCEGGGYGYLYIFHYMCRVFPEGFDPTEYIDESIYSILRFESSDGTDSTMFGARVSLGSGIPSQPVLDSTGDNLLIQKSDGSLTRLETNLLTKPLSVKGWLAQE
jgi:type IV pilus assembly protein PilY1